MFGSLRDAWNRVRRAGAGPGVRLDAELRAALDRDVLDAWFPRCIDRRHGGFLCDFDQRWNESGDHDKLLEFQARQTRVAALGCRLRPRDPAWAAATRHGVAVLRDVMWDRERGGFFALCRRDGRPLDGGDKHGHGTAYAIHALVDAARTLGDEETASFARRAFEWFDAAAWDAEHGGYWGWLRADGRPYASVPASAPRQVDHLGTPLGAKDTNVNGDALEALTELARWFDVPLARERVERLAGLFERLVAKTGCLPERLDRSWARLSDSSNAGNALQASYRLPLARELLGEPRLVGPTERALRRFAVSQRGPTGGIRSPLGDEQWWTQFELLRSAAFVAGHPGEDQEAARGELLSTWSYLERCFRDAAFGGFFFHPRKEGVAGVKGDRWKDGSHDGFALARAAALPV